MTGEFRSSGMIKTALNLLLFTVPCALLQGIRSGQ